MSAYIGRDGTESYGCVRCQRRHYRSHEPITYDLHIMDQSKHGIECRSWGEAQRDYEDRQQAVYATGACGSQGAAPDADGTGLSVTAPPSQGPTLRTRLAACLQQAGMACATCGGFGATVVSEDMRYVECSDCHGDGIASEYRQETQLTNAELREHEEAPDGCCSCGVPYVQVYGSGDVGCERCWTCGHCGTGLNDDMGQCPACHADDCELFYDH